MRKLGLNFPVLVALGIGALLVFSCFNRPSAGPDAASYSSSAPDAVAAADAASAPDVPKEFLQKAVDAIPKKEGWRSITVDGETKENEYDVTLDYSAPAPEFEIEDDTATIARAILKARVAAGHSPSTEDTHVFVHAERSGANGETSNDMVLLYGMSEYNPYHDAITYEPYKPLFGG